MTGLYFLDGRVSERAPEVKRRRRGFAWLDTSSHGSLLDAGNLVRTLQQRQGLQTGCLEEIACHQDRIDAAILATHAERLDKTDHGRYLADVLAGDPVQP